MPGPGFLERRWLALAPDFAWRRSIRCGVDSDRDEAWPTDCHRWCARTTAWRLPPLVNGALPRGASADFASIYYLRTSFSLQTLDRSNHVPSVRAESAGSRTPTRFGRTRAISLHVTPCIGRVSPEQPAAVHPLPPLGASPPSATTRLHSRSSRVAQDHAIAPAALRGVLQYRLRLSHFFLPAFLRARHVLIMGAIRMSATYHRQSISPFAASQIVTMGGPRREGSF